MAPHQLPSASPASSAAAAPAAAAPASSGLGAATSTWSYVPPQGRAQALGPLLIVSEAPLAPLTAPALPADLYPDASSSGGMLAPQQRGLAPGAEAAPAAPAIGALGQRLQQRLARGQQHQHPPLSPNDSAPHTAAAHAPGAAPWSAGGAGGLGVELERIMGAAAATSANVAELVLLGSSPPPPAAAAPPPPGRTPSSSGGGGGDGECGSAAGGGGSTDSSGGGDRGASGARTAAGAAGAAAALGGGAGGVKAAGGVGARAPALSSVDADEQMAALADAMTAGVLD
jgi:hypothetical protein